ncbi:MAG: HDOD domain-containing protein [bacterium]|nr:HDOD domain-containing protein [bacterium]
MDTTYARKNTNGKVLFFDVEEQDAPLADEAFEAMGIRPFETDDARIGLKTIQKEKIDIVLIDYSPLKNESLQFLQMVRKKFPSVNRISLCRESHRRHMINLLLKGVLSGYYEAPDCLDTLPKSISQILYARESLNNDVLLGLINKTEVLPTFPRVYHEFIDAVEADKSIKEIALIIEKDISIATQVLRIANSDFFRGGQIGSIERAGIYLGLGTIKNIVFAVSLSSVKNLSYSKRKALERIISHSLQVNRSFQKLYMEKTGEKLPEQYSSVGITHDIGKVIMMQYMPQRFKKIVKYREKNPDIDFYRSEIELGYERNTHAEIGAYFLNMWNFPEASVFTALFHHSFEEFSGPYQQLLEIFSLVNELAREVK